MPDTYSEPVAGEYTLDEADQSTTQVVVDQAGAVKDELIDGGGRVVDTAKDKAGDVVDEAKAQAADLLHQTQRELREQAALQQQRVADGLQNVSDELNEMARNSSGGLAADLVTRAASRAGSVASYLDGRDPGSLLSELRSFAARRPGAFVAGAVVVGVVAGRLTRSLASGSPEASNSSTSRPDGSPVDGLREHTPVHPPEMRRPTILNASDASADHQTDAATPLYSALLTDRDDGQASMDDTQNADVVR